MSSCIVLSSLSSCSIKSKKGFGGAGVELGNGSAIVHEKINALSDQNQPVKYICKMNMSGYYANIKNRVFRKYLLQHDQIECYVKSN